MKLILIKLEVSQDKKDNKLLATTSVRRVPIANNFRKCQTIKENTPPETDEALNFTRAGTGESKEV